MSVIPLFIFMGNIAFSAGISRRLYFAAYRWLGNLPGGLAMATIAGCAGFAAVCGSLTASVATMCTVALPEMKKYDYHQGLATGSIAAGGTLGVLMVIMVEVGSVTPPVGTGVYIISGIAKDTPLEVIFKGVLPFLLAFAVCLAILIAFPQIALFLPSFMH